MYIKHLLSWFLWDPPREAFTLPFVHWPIVWYSILFAMGFFLGYFIFLALLKRYFLFYPTFCTKEILESDSLKSYFQNPKSLFHQKNLKKELSVEVINSLIEDPASYQAVEEKHKNDAFFKEIQTRVAFLPKSLLTSAGMRLFFEAMLPNALMGIKEKSRMVLDHLAIYVVLGTVLGARIGHFLFYEHPMRYIRDPVSLLKVWEGGLASHGAIIGIILALLLFHLWSRRIAPSLNFASLLDLLCIPTALAGCFIRVGNFFNQEISGTVTDVPWAVIFGHPFDRSIPAPRHPVQIYEALFYLGTFCVLWMLSRRKSIFLKRGRLIGIFFLLVFIFRFFVEFFKEEQSSLLIGDSMLTMGQILSLPVILLGLVFIFLSKFSYKKEKKDHSTS